MADLYTNKSILAAKESAAAEIEKKEKSDRAIVSVSCEYSLGHYSLIKISEYMANHENQFMAWVLFPDG